MSHQYSSRLKQLESLKVNTSPWLQEKADPVLGHKELGHEKEARPVAKYIESQWVFQESGLFLWALYEAICNI